MVERIVVGVMNTNAYVLAIGKKECILVDPGGNAQEIIGRLKALNMFPLAIDCTHGHLDHTAAIPEIVDYYYSVEKEVPIAIHEADAAYLGKTARETHINTFKAIGAMDYFEEFYSPMPGPDIILKHGDTICDTDFTVIHTPGHTKGSICLYSKESSALLTGDTLFFEGVGRTDLPESSPQDLDKSISENLLHLSPETRVFPGHGPLSTLERELKHNPFLHV